MRTCRVVLWIDRGLGLVTLPQSGAVCAVVLWIDRGLGLVTLRGNRSPPLFSCGLTAGWGWLHYDIAVE